MEQKLSEIEMLKKRVKELECEIEYLKSVLAGSGIDYSNSAADDVVELFDPNQGARIIPVEITINHARQFFSYFWGRMDVYAKWYQNKTTDKVGYYPPCNNFWRRGVCPKVSGHRVKCKDCNNRSWKALDGVQIENHLRGVKEDFSDVIGTR